MATKIVERIRGRLVEIEVGAVPELGWVAIGIVTKGLACERDLRFEAIAESAAGAEARVRAEIEAYFA